MVRITVLGALTAQVAGVAARLGGPRQRGVLAQLLAARGEAVPADRLIENLWEGRPPAKAAVSLQAYVSNLRRLLEPGRGPRQEARLLVSEARGYALRDVGTDAAEFEALVRRAGGGSGGSLLLRQALALWRGPAYSEFADQSWAAVEAGRLADLRVAARELAVRRELGEGRLAEAVQEAAALTEEHPLREEGWRLLALGLWHSGRQADALAAVRRARTHFAEELGLDPGPVLGAVESAILHQRVEELTLADTGTGPLTAGTQRAAGPVVSDGATGEPGGVASVRGLADATGGAQRVAAVVAVGGVPGEPGGSVSVGAITPLRGLAAAAGVPGEPGGAARVGAITPSRGLADTTAGTQRAAGPVVSNGATGESGGVAPVRGLVDAWVGAERGASPVAVAVGAVRGAGVAWSHGRARGPLFVGREAELAALRGAAELSRGRVGFAVVSGEAGAGKSTLLGRLREELAGDGWLVATGRCPESAGAPAAWAWTEVLREVGEQAPSPQVAGELAPLLAESGLTVRQDALSGRFRLHRAVIARLREAAARAPLAVLLDDLHAADPETRSLLAELAADQAVGGVAGLLVVLSLRPGEGELAEVLAPVARRSPVRVALAGLPPAEAGRLIEAVCARAVGEETVRALSERTGGNPFYLTESAQLLAVEGESSALREVPQGVREVLRRRVERLSGPAVDLLRLAAVAGREVEAELLLRAGDLTEDAAVEAVEAAVAGGLLTEPRPGVLRFAHVLVRETLYADLGGLRRARLHGRIGQALRELRPDRLTALAHHFTQAASAASAELAVEYCVRAAETAERRYAHESCAGLLRQAVENLDRSPDRSAGDRAARRIELLGALLRAQVRAGEVTAAGETKAAAVRAARESGREDLLIAAWTAWTEPTPWVTHAYGTFDQEAIDTLTGLLRRTDLAPAVRCRLLDALTYELDCTGSAAAVNAATEAVAIARAEGDPRLLCLALASQARAHDYELQADDRLALATELAELAAAHDLPAYRWHAANLAASVAAVHGDLPALRRHLSEGLEIARRYGLAELADIGLCQLGMLELTADRPQAAVELYQQALTGLASRGSVHADAFGALVWIVIAFRQGRIAETLPLIERHQPQYGSLVADVAALALAAAGRTAEAREARRERHRVQPDYYRSLFLVLRAAAVVALDERAEAAELIEELRPLADLVAGAGSTSIAVRPVALALGELAAQLGRTAEAAGYFRLALEVARRWEAPHWEAEARQALTAIGQRPALER
ncbi:BTAD domain-containing putative transcriptional regulator [Kitasatospora sp. NPDC049285]|uniref:BTAD domain-containing putative transcriptional regulator n=1 Tax=Kitasatospora sp. NPDC049285 TaxID=3157096 RepID=UPI003417B6CF